MFLSATASPCARKARVALIDKGTPFELVTEVLWGAATGAPEYDRSDGPDRNRQGRLSTAFSTCQPCIFW
jgi:glutathione S-transferase